MPIKYLTTLLLYLYLTVNVFAQNDCSEALVVCGNSDYRSLSASGVGIQELTNSNTCSSQENNSLWLQLNIKTGGTLGFVLEPTSNNIDVDFDFFVFGPNATCNNLGQAIRCSTTNPAAAGSTSNHTGMNNFSVDTSEGPGADGNNFVQWLTVQDGEVYYLVIDRPVGTSDFSLRWTGTARFNSPPVFNLPNNLSLSQEVCDDDGTPDGINQFDLNLHTATIIGSQVNVAVTYHTNRNDATTGQNPIDTSVPFINNVINQTIYTRITDTITGCYDVETYRLTVNLPPAFINPQNISLDLEVCDNNGGNDGIAEFNLLRYASMLKGTQPNVQLTCHYSQAEADTGANPITNTASFQNTANPQQLYFRLFNTVKGCYNTKSFNLIVKDIPVFNLPSTGSINLVQCDNDAVQDQKTSFNLTTFASTLIGAQTNMVITYFESESNAIQGTGAILNPVSYTNTASPQILYMRMDNTATGCFTIQNFTLTVYLLPVFNNPGNIAPKLEECDADGVDDKSYIFDLTTNAAMFIGSQSNMSISYYTSITDAEAGSNAITTPAAFRNTLNPQTIFVVMTNGTTGCSSINTFEAEVVELLDAGDPADIELCDTGNDGFELFNLSQNNALLQNGNTATYVEYYASEADAQAQVNELSIPYQNAVAHTSQTIWARLQNSGGCIGFDIKPFTIIVNEIPEISFTANIIEFTNQENSLTVVMQDIDKYEFSLDGITYTNDPAFNNLTAGVYNVFVRSKTQCKTVNKEFVVLNYPRFFTPNGDGANDYWRIPYLQLRGGAEIFVFDRFGKLISNFNSSSTGWNGTYNGMPLPSTDYWFVLKFNDGSIIRGHFAMLR